MLKLSWVGAVCAGFSACAVSSGQPSISSIAPSTLAPAPSPTLNYRVYAAPSADVYVLRIPADAQFVVTPAVGVETAPLKVFAQQHHAIAVLNGGFFDPQNHQSTSYITIQGQQVADPTQNPRLVGNPDLAPYLDKILNRSEFRRYRCGEHQRYAITRHQETIPPGCELVDALGAGPQLLPSLDLEAEGFTATNSNGAVVRDAIGSSQPNARTAVGITATGDLIWVMVAQKQSTSTGMTLPELARFLQTLGAVAALNLDGGSSSSLFYQGKTIQGKLNSAGEPVTRPVKSVLLLTAQ